MLINSFCELQTPVPPRPSRSEGEAWLASVQLMQTHASKVKEQCYCFNCSHATFNWRFSALEHCFGMLKQGRAYMTRGSKR